MALTTRQAAVRGAAVGLVLGISGGYVAGGLWVLRHARRALRLAAQHHRRIVELDHSVCEKDITIDELERTVREKDAAIAPLRTARPPIIIDEWAPLGTILGLADRLTWPTDIPAINLTALALDPDRARAYNPLPTADDERGDAPVTRLDR